MRFIYTRSFAIFASCLVGLALVIFLQTKGWLGLLRYAVVQSPRPLVTSVKAVVNPVRNFFGTIYQLKKITSENAQLSNRVKQLDQNLADYEQLKKENDALRQELGFVRSSKLSLIPCTVLAPNAFGFTDAVTLNCGQDFDVQEGQAVLSEGFLVGKILYVSKNTSTALLASSAKFSTDARLAGSGAAGLAMGSYGSGMVLDQLPQNTSVNKGDMVVSAGISEKIPKDIPIGEVGETLSTSNDLFKKTTLLSPIDFNTLEFVFVVQQ